MNKTPKEKSPEELAIEQLFIAHKQVINASQIEDIKFAEEAEKDKWNVWEMTR